MSIVIPIDKLGAFIEHPLSGGPVIVRKGTDCTVAADPVDLGFCVAQHFCEPGARSYINEAQAALIEEQMAGHIKVQQAVTIDVQSLCTLLTQRSWPPTHLEPGAGYRVPPVRAKL